MPEPDAPKPASADQTANGTRDSSGRGDGRAAIAIICLVTGGIAAAGLALAALAPAFTGMSAFKHFEIETIVTPLWVATLILLALFAMRAGTGLVTRMASIPLERLSVPLIAALAGLAAGLGTLLPGLGNPFSMDEWVIAMQSEIFGAGELAAVLPPEWAPHRDALFHVFAHRRTPDGVIASSYLPGMAALVAALDKIRIGDTGLGFLTSAMTTAGSVLLAASIARQLFAGNEPRATGQGHGSAPTIAAVLVATSGQVLVTGATYYAMPLLLLLNLLWLRLFLVNSWPAHLAAAGVGAAATAVHQLHLHLMFCLPFFLFLLRPFRPGVILVYAAVYSATVALLLEFQNKGFFSDRNGEPGYGTFVADLASAPSGDLLLSTLIQLTRFLTWQNIALVPLLMALVLAGRRAGLIGRHRVGAWILVLAATLVTLLAPRVIVGAIDQGHGWGYRYLHSAIGSLALLGAAGWIALAKTPLRLRAFVATALVAGPLLLVPAQAWLADRTSRPFAAAGALIARQPAEIVWIDPSGTYYGQDLVRNDPFLQRRPVVMDLSRMNLDGIAALCARHETLFLGPEAFAEFGLLVVPDTAPMPQTASRHAARMALLEEHCPEALQVR